MADKITSPLYMDDDAQYLGNSPGDDARGRLHTKISNNDTEAIPVKVLGIIDTTNTIETKLRLQNQAIYRVQDGQLVRTVYDGSLDITVVDGGTVVVKLE